MTSGTEEGDGALSASSGKRVSRFCTNNENM